jgi:hypothetical protein
LSAYGRLGRRRLSGSGIEAGLTLASSTTNLASLLGTCQSDAPTRVRVLTFEEMERGLRQRLQALPPAARAELLHVLTLPDFER